MEKTLKRAAELLRQYGRMANTVKAYQGDETLQVAADIERMAQAEPVAGQCKFSCEQKWQPCSVEHHYHVLANPAEWPGYETRLLYTHPRLPRDVLMAIARDAQRAAIQSCDEAGGDMGALHGIDLDAIVDRHAEKSAQAEPVAHLVAMSNGDDDAWFEVADGDGKYDFPVYAAPRLPRDVLMAVAREVQRAAIQSCDEAGGDMGALHGIDLAAIVDQHAEKPEQNSSSTFNAASEETPSAVLSYRLKASTGYECEGRQEGITPEQWGRICEVLAAAKSAQAQEGCAA